MSETQTLKVTMSVCNDTFNLNGIGFVCFSALRELFQPISSGWDNDVDGSGAAVAVIEISNEMRKAVEWKSECKMFTFDHGVLIGTGADGEFRNWASRYNSEMPESGSTTNYNTILSGLANWVTETYGSDPVTLWVKVTSVECESQEEDFTVNATWDNGTITASEIEEVLSNHFCNTHGAAFSVI